MTGTPPLPRRIWLPWENDARRAAFSRTFTVGQAAVGRLVVSTGGKYQIWLDERRLPVPDSLMPSWRMMHAYDLRLEPGEHTLFVLARQGENPQPFFLACLDWVEGDIQRRMVTDEEWRMTAMPPRKPAAAADWQPAWTFDGVWAEPWGMPCNTPDDFCRLNTGWQEVVTELLLAVVDTFAGFAASADGARVGNDGTITMRPVQPYARQPLRVPDRRPSSMWHLVREIHSQQANTWLQTYEGRAPYLVLDAGAETFARVKLRLKHGGPAVLAVTTGESLLETHHYIRRVTDVIELRDGESFATTPVGFRYLKLTALGCMGETFELEPVEIQHLRYPVKEAGSFRCSDSMMDEIFRLSAQTIRLCMQNEIWDGVRRDQLPWMGDLYVEALASYACFGDTRLARRTLAVLADLAPVPAKPLPEQRYPGLQAIWKRVGGDMNGIPTYTMWWAVGLHDYWMYSGDRSLLLEVASDLAGALEHITRHVGADGLWMDRESRLYVDWAPISAAGRYAFCHLLATQALALGADLLETVGQHQSAEKYRAASRSMAEAARAAWWDGTAAKLATLSSHHVPAMAVRSGIFSAGEARLLFANTLANDPSLRMTFWHRYADLDAAARTENIAWGLDYLRRHWGPAIEAGVTALWEAFEADWNASGDPHRVSIIADEYGSYGGYRTSLCHGWSAGGAVWLQRAVLGVTPIQPGFAAVRFAPDLGSLDWAEGEVPTPRGVIRVRLERREGKPWARIDVPEGTTVEMAADGWEVKEG